MAQLRSIQSIRADWQRPKKIGHNTKAWYNADGFSIRYHSSNVISYDSLGDMLHVNPCGWFSKTTAERIRHGLRELNLQLLTSDLPGRWRVADHNGNAWTIRGGHLILKRVDGKWQRVH